jgi:dihydrodipicolinate synthase/N-acetylneuraminate lyase
VEHCCKIAETIPLFGFYLQPAVGGRELSYAFWRSFVEIPNVVAIKVAAFDRYRTLDVVRAVAESGRGNEIALYTGNDDNIVLDLLTNYAFPINGTELRVRFVGGLLGHWACWTLRAVELLEQCKTWRSQKVITAEALTLAAQVTDANAAIFDAANRFAGCIPGIHEVLRRQGLLEGTWCLEPAEDLSPGQSAEIHRIYASYPALNDDEFVREKLEDWLDGSV